MAKQNAFLGASDWVGPKPSDPSPIIYHGGVENSHKGAPVLDAGQGSFCVSYFKLFTGATKTESDYALHHGHRRFLDSGAFSFLSKVAELKATDVPKYLDAYAAWLHKNTIALDFYITFDYAVEATLVFAMTAALQKRGCNPVPVYHGDSSLDWLKKYIDLGHRLICLSKRNFVGDRKRLFRYYDQAFNLGEKCKVSFHGLACGAGDEVWDYPWYSVDSTSVMRAAVGGEILTLTRNHRIKSIPVVSSRVTKLAPEILEQATQWGLSLSELQSSSYRRMFYSAKTIGEMQKLRKAKQWKSKSLF
jgi:hypothetical protein